MTTPAPRALVVGEALVDVVRRDSEAPVVLPGGSPLNVAVGLARLGVGAALHSQIGIDPHGQLLADHVGESGVTLTRGTVGASSTSVAEATIGTDGSATYDFRISWDPSPFDARGYDLVHAGSLGAALEPGASRVEEALAAATGLVSFDPNVRPALMPDLRPARARIERIVARADVVKASDEDVAWLYPGQPLSEILASWRALGARLVVITRGPDGADALSDEGTVHVDVPPTRVADTIGAGDSFMAGLLAHVLEFGFADVAASLAFAARCAAVTVGRPGADPPRRSELAG